MSDHPCPPRHRKSQQPKTCRFKDTRRAISFIAAFAYCAAIFMPLDAVSEAALKETSQVAPVIIAFYFGARGNDEHQKNVVIVIPERSKIDADKIIKDS